MSNEGRDEFGVRGCGVSPGRHVSLYYREVTRTTTVLASCKETSDKWHRDAYQAETYDWIDYYVAMPPSHHKAEM